MLALVLSLLLQDPKTVEDRLKELDAKVALLEKKQAALSTENAALEQQLAARDAVEREIAAGWVRPFVAEVQLSGEQIQALQALRVGWQRTDRAKPADRAAWLSREAALKATLTEAQVPRFVRAVREGMEKGARSTVVFFLQVAKLPADKSAAVEKAVMSHYAFEDGVLLLEAHPDKVSHLGQVGPAFDAALPELRSTLTDGEIKTLKGLLEQWAPKR